MSRLAAALASLAAFGDVPVQLIVKPSAGGFRELDGSTAALPGVLEDAACEGLLTLIFGPLPLRLPYPAPLHAIAANGLAG
jgi:hypothetical protein